MEILGRTSLGNFIVIVSDKELETFYQQKETTTASFDWSKSEVGKLLDKVRPGGQWRWWLAHLADDGKIDGTIVQLKKIIEADEPYLYDYRLSRLSIQKIYNILNDHS